MRVVRWITSCALVLVSLLLLIENSEGRRLFLFDSNNKKDSTTAAAACSEESTWKQCRNVVSSSSKNVVHAESVLRDFLASPEGSVPENRFYVHGWRWHTMSVIRESKRLQRLALRLDPSREEHLDCLGKAVDYVMGFNQGALRRVETMFFAWIRQNVDSKNNKSVGEVVKALNTVLDHLDLESKQISKLSLSLTKNKGDGPARIREVAETSSTVSDLTQSMLRREITYVIPTVAQLIPQASQDKFNNRVISTLGVFDSRLHLVHMHEVVAEQKSADEEKLWKEAIPSFPRSLISRWKRTLYEPKAGCLNDYS